MHRRLYMYFIASAILLVNLLVAGIICHAEPIGKKVLIVAGDEQFPPYEFVDVMNGSKVYRGFNVDILRSIALYTGYEIQFRPMPWAEALQALERGEVDAVSGMKYDPEREKVYDFSQEYMISSQAIFVMKDMSAIAALEDLVGKKVAVQKNDIAYYQLKAQPIDLTLTLNQEAALQLLLDHKVDAVVGNKLTGQYILQKVKSMDQVKIVGGTIEPQRYCVAVKKGNAILDVFNKGIKEIKSNGTYEKIYAKWFGEPVDHPAQYYKKNLLLALWGLVLLLALAIIIVRVNFVLKREVWKRTQQIEKVNQELLKKNEYIKQSNKYKEKMLNSDYSGVVTVSKEGVIQFANAYAQKYLALSSDLIVGQHYRHTYLWELMNSLDIENIASTSTHEFQLGKVCIEYKVDELAVNNGDNEIILHFRDITAEKHLREEIIKKDKMEALGNLVACIAHEIRNPLTSIKTFTELIPVKYDNPRFRDKISQCVPQEIERLNNIISDLLAYANPKQVCRQPISLKSLVDGTLVLLADTVSRQEIDLKVEMDEQAMALVDKQQIKQVMINVLLNAIQALEGIANPCLTIKGWQNAQVSGLQITDNGCGIEADHLDKIFEPFFTTKPSGTGLGLFVSYQLVKQNDAHLIIESQPDKGTSVTLQFPCWHQEGKVNV